MKTYTIEEIKSIAFDCMDIGEADNDQRIIIYFTMRRLIDRLEAAGEPEAPKAENKPAAKKPAPEKKPAAAPKKFMGHGAKEKQAIYGRLIDARVDNKCSVADIVKASGGKLTDELVITAISANKIPMEKWLAIGAALDKLEADG